MMLNPEACSRAVSSRDPRFDGVFFVGITTTRIYCRPVCPARVSYPERRRFFDSAAAAERSGFRPCLRCRPELAPGRALCDAVPRLARAHVPREHGAHLRPVLDVEHTTARVRMQTDDGHVALFREARHFIQLLDRDAEL